MNTPDSPFDTVEEALAAMAAGQVVVVTDDEDRENEGDLIMAASKATPETVNMMIRYGSGIVCVPAEAGWLDRLGLGPMVARNREVQRTDFAVSVDAASGISTGVSAADRTIAIRLLADSSTRPEQLVQPGHVFPLRARPGGVLERAGHTEAAVDLAVLAGLEPCGVLCELVNDDGTMQRLPQLIEFKRKFGLKMISIEQLIAYRLKQDNLVERVSEQLVSLPQGEFVAHVFRSRLDGRHHLALTHGDLRGTAPVLVRAQRANVLADVFHCHIGSEPCDAVDRCLARIAEEIRGVLLYIDPPDPSKRLLPPSPSAEQAAMSRIDLRDYGLGAQILRALGLHRIRLLTNHPRKLVGWEAYGIDLVEQIPIAGTKSGSASSSD